MRIGRQSSNVEDRRGMRGGGSGGRLPVRGLGGLGLGGLLILVALGYVITGDPLGLIGTQPGAPAGSGVEAPTGPPSDEAGRFVSGVLADTEDTWDQIFARTGRRYEHPRLVLFSDAVDSACGMGSAATGPFYCPGDARIYLDLTFFRELDQGFGAPGDFAQAYVVAHEVGHHVQNILGLLGRTSGMDRATANAISIQQELQADCFAGVWGHYAAAKGMLETGDVEEGLRAAAAIGDDRIQRRTQGRVSPETWTHGSSADRVRWFRTGLESGQTASCDTR